MKSPNPGYLFSSHGSSKYQTSKHTVCRTPITYRRLRHYVSRGHWQNEHHSSARQSEAHHRDITHHTIPSLTHAAPARIMRAIDMPSPKHIHVKAPSTPHKNSRTVLKAAETHPPQTIAPSHKKVLPAASVHSALLHRPRMNLVRLPWPGTMSGLQQLQLRQCNRPYHCLSQCSSSGWRRVRGCSGAD